MVAEPNARELIVINTVFGGLAVITTIFRLVYRWHLRRLWWDDGWAAFAMTSQLLLLCGSWTHFMRTGVPALLDGILATSNEQKHARVVAYWIVSYTFTTVLWSARMSILYSTIRIIPKTLGLRRTAYYCAMLFGCMWTALMIQKSIICGRDTVWQRKPQPQCHLGLQVGVLELVTDCISDCILVIIPLRLLWNVNLPRNLRKLLFTIFSASILVTAVSVVHAAFVLGPSGSLEGISANVESAVSLMVADLAVIMTFLYRFVKGREIDHVSDDSLALDTKRLEMHSSKVFGEDSM